MFFGGLLWFIYGILEVYREEVSGFNIVFKRRVGLNNFFRFLVKINYLNLFYFGYKINLLEIDFFFFKSIESCIDIGGIIWFMMKIGWNNYWLLGI